MPGRQAGTDQWLVWLRDRSYDLRQEVQQIRSAATAAQRRTLLTQLEQRAATDQAALTTLVTSNGGTVLQHYWVLSMLAVEVPPAALPVLRAHPRVLRLVPVRSRHAAEMETPVDVEAGPLPPPIATSTDSNNHCVDAARAILGLTPASFGNGVRVAVFDSGIDSDAGGAVGPFTLHPSFADPANPNQSRIDAHLRAGSIDCNNITAAGSYGTIGPFAYRPCKHSTSALHGTAMAGIIAGNAVPFFGYVDGHVPQARIIDVSITDPPTGAYGWTKRWELWETHMLDAIQLLRSQIIESGNPVHVLNISYSGWSDPADPVPVALDELAITDDILVISAAGNIPDETRLSNGNFNGLAVGSVHARDSASAPFIPMYSTATGPLNSDHRRFYPDVCATGAGTGTQYGDTYYNNGLTNNVASCLRMPMVDVGPPHLGPGSILLWDPCSMSGAHVLPGTQTCVPISSTYCSGPTTPPFGIPVPAGATRYGLGTSEAAAQVSGAAALYRAARPSATAEETRAAILLNVLSPFSGTYPGGTGQDIHAYTARNTFGVGYVRDDFLAEFAARLTAIQPLHKVVNLTPSNPTAWVQYPPSGTGTMSSNSRYSFAICWPRAYPEDASVGVPDIDLEVWNSATNPTVCFARSTTPANNYERLTLPAGANASGTVFLKITAVSFAGADDATVTAVGRQFEPDLDPATPPPTIEATPVHAGTGTIQSLDAGTNCTSSNALDLSVTRAVPTDYADAWGSKPLNYVFVTNPPFSYTLPDFHGVNIAAPANGPGQTSVHIEIRGGTNLNDPVDHVGPSMSIGGIAFRMWRPFTGSGPLTINWVKMGQSSAGAVSSSSNSLWMAPGIYNPPLGSGVIQAVNDFAPTSFDTWSLVIPFTQPFPYTAGNNLHIWIQVGGTLPLGFEVDGAADGTSVSSYGMLFGSTGGTTIGSCPIIGLIPAPQPSTLPPKLIAYGEPWVGRSLELQLSQAPPSQTAIIVFGSWTPGSQIPCAIHVTSGSPPLFPPLFLICDQFGVVRAPFSIPLHPAFLHLDLGIQAAVSTGSGMLMSNGLKVTIGGAL